MCDKPGRQRLDWHGRRQGRRLRPRRQRLVEALLPRLRVSLPVVGSSLDPFLLFDRRPQQIWLEIGFGSGEHLAAQAERHTHIGFIGSEVFANGIAALLDQIEQRKLANVRIFDDDVRLLLPYLPEACLARAFLLFPDPWPKKRHGKRRFIGPANLGQLARLLVDGGELRIVSDNAGYIRWTLEQVVGCPAFRWQARRPDDWRRGPADWVGTRYQGKAQAAGRPVTFLSFERRRRSA